MPPGSVLLVLDRTPVAVHSLCFEDAVLQTSSVLLSCFTLVLLLKFFPCCIHSRFWLIIVWQWVLSNSDAPIVLLCFGREGAPWKVLIKFLCHCCLKTQGSRCDAQFVLFSALLISSELMIILGSYCYF